MQALLVCKSLEERGKIMGLYLFEAMLLIMSTVLTLILTMAARSYYHFSLLWCLTAPALVSIAFLLLTTSRKHRPPFFLLSCLTFYCLAPRKLTLRARPWLKTTTPCS